MSNIATDSIPGGLVLHNLGHKPVKVYSHTERKQKMKEAGLKECVYHVPGDKFASDWNVGSSRGREALPMAMLTIEEQEARRAEWLSTEPK